MNLSDKKVVVGYICVMSNCIEDFEILKTSGTMIINDRVSLMSAAIQHDKVSTREPQFVVLLVFFQFNDAFVYSIY